MTLMFKELNNGSVIVLRPTGNKEAIEVGRIYPDSFSPIYSVGFSKEELHQILEKMK